MAPGQKVNDPPRGDVEFETPKFKVPSISSVVASDETLLTSNTKLIASGVQKNGDLPIRGVQRNTQIRVDRDMYRKKHTIKG